MHRRTNQRCGTGHNPRLMAVLAHLLKCLCSSIHSQHLVPPVETTYTRVAALAGCDRWHRSTQRHNAAATILTPPQQTAMLHHGITSMLPPWLLMPGFNHQVQAPQHHINGRAICGVTRPAPAQRRHSKHTSCKCVLAILLDCF